MLLFNKENWMFVNMVTICKEQGDIYLIFTEISCVSAL